MCNNNVLNLRSVLLTLMKTSRVTELEQKIESWQNELQNYKQSSGSPQQPHHSNQSPVYTGLPNQPYQNHFSPISSIQQNTIGQRSSLSGTPISAERGTTTSSGLSKTMGPNGSYEFVNENDQFSNENNNVNDNGDPKLKINPKMTKVQQIQELIGSNALSDVSTLVTQVAENRFKRIHSPHIDLIEHGLLTFEEAKEKLQLYIDTIFAKYPFVDVPHNFEEFRANYPILFNVVMAVSCIINNKEEDVDKVLDIENIAAQQVIHEVCLIGNKSIELLKSLMLFTIWYNMPELFHHRRYHIFSALCIAMTQDLGLTGRPYYVVNKSEGSVLRSAMLEDPQKDEYKCLVLAVYSSSIGYSLFLRRKLVVTWTPYFEECYQSLRNCPIVKYKTVAIFAKLSSLLEKIHSFVEAKDQENLSFIHHFQSGIDYLKNQITSLDSDVLLGFAYSVEAFLYSKFTSFELSHKCLHSTLRCLYHFACLTPDQFSYVPLIIYGRLMYCFALLLKTSNYLNCDFDFSSIKKIMNTLDDCNKIYKTNHLLVKTKLLFYFYLTTYSKNENVFNELANVSSSDSVVEAHSQHSSLHGTPNSSTYNQQPIPPPMSGPQSMMHQQQMNQGQTHMQHQQQQQSGQNTYNSLNIPTPNLQSPMGLNIPSTHQHTPNLPGPPPPPSSLSSSTQQTMMQPYPQINNHPHPQPHHSHHHQQQQQPHHQPQPQSLSHPQQMNVYPGLNMSNANSLLPHDDRLEARMEPIYPQLDVLSDATMKGFGDIPTELMGQDEFWKLFDYKDEQFLL